LNVLANDNSLNTYNSVKLPNIISKESNEIKKSQSVIPNSRLQDRSKEESFKALKETLENTKLNFDLQNFIQDKLISLMIDYNQGFIMSLTIQEKQELKEMIDQIGEKNIEQIYNKQMVQEEELEPKENSGSNLSDY
jgi:molybdenum cofactor biosynthesis enzyme MoaA